MSDKHITGFGYDLGELFRCLAMAVQYRVGMRYIYPLWVLVEDLADPLDAILAKCCTATERGDIGKAKDNGQGVTR